MEEALFRLDIIKSFGFDSFGVVFVLFTIALPFGLGWLISHIINVNNGGWQKNINETVSWSLGVLAFSWICIYIWISFSK